MAKIPVFRTIGSAYGFAFGNLATIVGLIWLPLGLLLAMQYYVAVRYMNGYVQALSAGNLYELNRANGVRWLSIGAGLLLQAIMITPVMRQALGLRQGGAFISFAIGPTALRVVGALIALDLVILAIVYIGIIPLIAVIAGLLVSAKIVGSLHGVAAMTVTAYSVLGSLFVYVCFVFFVVVRLSYLLVAVVVAENRIDLIHAWRLTNWNFWRIFWVIVATMLPLALLYLPLLWAALGYPGFHLPSAAFLAQWKGAPTKAFAWFANAYIERLPYILAVFFIMSPLAIGLTSGAAAAAYRSLVPQPEGKQPEAAAEASPA